MQLARPAVLLALTAVSSLGLLAPRSASAARAATSRRAVVGHEAPADDKLAARAPGGSLELPQAHAKAADPALTLRGRAVSLQLDAFGSFGRATAGADALFDDGSTQAPTVFECLPHVKGVGFLDSQSLLMPPSFAGATRIGEAVVASYRLGPWGIDVRSELADCDRPHCGVLRQRFTLTNLSAAASDLVFTSYLDGDLFFAGTYANDFGARRGEVTYQFDEGSDPAAPTTYLGLSSRSEAALRTAREVGEYSEQRRRIAQGGLLSDRLVRADGRNADRDGDGVTDAGFDVSVAAAHDFGSLAPGDVVEIVTEVQWGIGALDDVGQSPPPTARAGADMSIECAGPGGTVAWLDGSASEASAGIVAHRWHVDGVLAAEGVTAEVVLSLGTHWVVLEVEDVEGRIDRDSIVVEVVDTQAPEVSVGGPVRLWPPDHRLVRVDVPVMASDACSETVELKLLEVTSDELPDARRGGDGGRSPDVVAGADGSLWLRRERQGGGDGRVYRIHGVATDASGLSTPFEVEVHVPHSPGSAAQDSGAASVTSLP